MVRGREIGRERNVKFFCETCGKLLYFVCMILDLGWNSNPWIPLWVAMLRSDAATELIVATLDNSCDSTRHAAVCLRSGPEVALHSTKNMRLIYFWWKHGHRILLLSPPPPPSPLVFQAFHEMQLFTSC